MKEFEKKVALVIGGTSGTATRSTDPYFSDFKFNLSTKRMG